MFKAKRQAGRAQMGYLPLPPSIYGNLDLLLVNIGDPGSKLRSVTKSI